MEMAAKPRARTSRGIRHSSRAKSKTALHEPAPARLADLKIGHHKAGQLLDVKQQENTQYDQGEGPEPREKHLPTGPHFRAAFEQADRESGNRKTQVLSLDALHDGHVGHVIPATHAAAVLVKEE